MDFSAQQTVRPRPSRWLEAWLEDRLAAEAPGQALPPARQLAGQFGVSKVTVERTMRRLRNQGRIVRIPGKGSFVAGETEPPPVVLHPPLSSAESLADHLATLVARGVYRLGMPLPPRKYLIREFSVSPLTVRRAYSLLQSRGLVVRVGRTCVVGADLAEIGRVKRRGDVYLFGYTDPTFAGIFADRFLGPSYRRMERELLAAGLRVHCEDVGCAGALARRWAETKEFPAGVVFCAVTDGQIDTVHTLLHHLHGRGRGCSTRLLIDWWYGDYSRLPKDTCIVARGNILTTTARALARYLVLHGRTGVTFCIDPNRPGWGFTEANWLIIKIRAELTPFERNLRIGFILPSTGRLASYAQFVRSFGRTREPQDMLSKHKPTSLAVLEREIVFRADPLAEIEHRGARDVWVFSTAQMTAAAWEAARRKGLNIPSDLWLLSMEDDMRYCHLGLSYCGPDFDRIGYLMAHCIIGDIPVARTTKRLLRTAGIVVDKLTTP